ncbi:MAG TPA: hypothetical protein VLW25_06420 [Bryobacteraceae bacterium]|nr:hypothetical protein [Bryobacteraceae bacterium]
MPNIFNDGPWPGLITWMLLYISDYYLTISGARLYRSGPNQKIVYEGSYELTPYFQRDIDALRRISPRFFAMLVIFGSLLVLVWHLASADTPQLYQVVLGASILMQLAIHTRHLRNRFIFREIKKEPDAVRGRIEYSRAFILRASSHELFVFAAFFLCLFIVTQSWLFAGGALAGVAAGAKHLRLVRKLSAGQAGAKQHTSVESVGPTQS